MKFRYFLLADAANAASDGKVNLLGVGVQVVNTRSLPTLSPLAIVGSIEGTLEEAGSYPLEIAIDGPEGKVTVAKGDLPFAENAAESGADPELPVAVSFQISLPLRFNAEGMRTIRARYGKAKAVWLFKVRLIDGDASEKGAEPK